jgi:basic membrane lipoprotein Med (substrate-binding protein (PBP1-ABC) superfamily)
VDGVAYDAPTEKVDFSASGGGNDIAPINDMGGTIPQDVIDQVMEVRQQILDGDLVVKIRTE